MKSLIKTLTVFMFFCFSESCSQSKGYEVKSTAELTKLAPLVLYANVVATDSLKIHEQDLRTIMQHLMSSVSTKEGN